MVHCWRGESIWIVRPNMKVRERETYLGLRHGALGGGVRDKSFKRLYKHSPRPFWGIRMRLPKSITHTYFTRDRLWRFNGTVICARTE